MECTDHGCPCESENRRIVHLVRPEGQVVLIRDVPAEVCTVCGDVLFTPETVRHIEALLRSLPAPAGSVPLYEYA